MTADITRVEGRSAPATGLCQALTPVLQAAERLDIDTDWAEATLGAPIDVAVEKNLRVPWDQFMSVFSEFGRRLRPHGGWEALDSIIDGTELSLAGRALGLFFSPALLYRIMWTRVAPIWFPHLESTFEEIDETQFRFTLEIPEPYAFDRGYFEVTRLMLCELPTVSGVPPATVEVDVDGRLAVFIAQTEPPRTIRARVKRRVGNLLSDIFSAEFDRERAQMLEGFATLEAEQARLDRLSRHRLSAVTKTGTAVVEVDLDRGEQSATPGVFELFGVEPDDPRNVFGVWAESTIEEHSRRIGEALEAVQSSRYCIVVETKLNDGRWLRARLNRSGDKFEGIVFATWIDITDEHEAQENARRSLQRLERVLSVAPFATVVYSRGEVLFKNNAFDGLPDDTLGRLVEYNDDITLDGDANLLTLPSTHREVDTMLRVHSTAIDWEGRPAILATLEDVTLANELVERSMVMDRMAATGTHAAGIAHEINNPLAYVQSNLEFAHEVLDEQLKDDEELVDVREAIDDANLGVSRVREVVASLKDFSRMSADEAVATDLHEVVNRAVNVVWSDLRSRAELVTRYDIDCAVVAEPISLSQALVALFQNAAHAIPAGVRGRIDVNVVNAGGEAILTITDNGEGIPDEILPRVFDPFFTTRPTGEGAGLGLSLARSRIERMGGSLRLICPPDGGTTAEIRLATMPADAPDAPTAPEAE